MSKPRTIDSMHIQAGRRAFRLWETMQELPEGDGFERARDAYHAMFKDDKNFTANTEPYSRAE
jgi:hypothetical protein